MSTPAISIVVPTCGREASIRRLLCALAVQERPPDFEVVIVADGVRAGATGVTDPSAWPFAVRVVEQARRGAAQARNLGAAAAQAPLLLFFDDDVEPARETVRAHLDHHDGATATIGAGELEPRSTVGGFIGHALRGWWERMNDDLADPRHRFTFRDLLTGHCSMTAATFAGIGGFDTTLRCQEDFDFGYRAVERGVELRYVRAARAVHHDASDLDKILRRKFDEGIANVQLAAKHPSLLRALPAGRALATGRAAAWIQSVAVSQPTGHALVDGGLRTAMATFERLHMRDKWREALERLMDYWYWRGVRAAAGSAERIRSLRAGAWTPERPMLELDLADGIEHAERLLDERRPQALRIVLGRELVYELRDVPGAEPLRGVHLRPLLLKDAGSQFAAAARRSGSLPGVLAGCVPEAAALAEAAARTDHGQAA